MSTKEELKEQIKVLQEQLRDQRDLNEFHRRINGELDQIPIDQEQFMLIEFMAEQLEGVQKQMDTMMSNTVNIDFLKDQVLKLQDDVEELKDRVRENKNGH